MSIKQHTTLPSTVTESVKCKICGVVYQPSPTKSLGVYRSCWLAKNGLDDYEPVIGRGRRRLD
jgi:hypothetical protein